jgi:TRAP-type mannitol/chloroaromatic compound transport system substrate-binding protein
MRKEPTLPMPAKSGEELLGEIEDEISSIVRQDQSNSIATREMTAPERLGEELAKAILAVANETLAEVQTFAQQAQARADKIREDAKAFAKEHEEFMARFHELGNAMLSSHKKYTDTKG